MFDYTRQINYLQINSNIFRNLTPYKYQKISKHTNDWAEDTFALNRQKYIRFQRKEDRYTFDYVVTDPNLNYLDILFDYRRALRFKVVVDK